MDANGKPIGAVVGITPNGSVTVAVTVTGRGALLTAAAGIFVPDPGAPVVLAGPQPLRFESADCSGVALLVDLPVVEGAAIAPPGLTLYLTDLIAPRALTAHSALDTFGFCGFDSIGPRLYHSAVPVLDLLTVFTPPFRLRFGPVGW